MNRNLRFGIQCIHHEAVTGENGIDLTQVEHDDATFHARQAAHLLGEFLLLVEIKIDPLLDVGHLQNLFNWMLKARIYKKHH